MFDFANIDEISRKARQVEQELHWQTGWCFGTQARKSFYKKGPDSDFNQTPQ